MMLLLFLTWFHKKNVVCGSKMGADPCTEREHKEQCCGDDTAMLDADISSLELSDDKEHIVARFATSGKDQCERIKKKTLPDSTTVKLDKGSSHLFFTFSSTETVEDIFSAKTKTHKLTSTFDAAAATFDADAMYKAGFFIDDSLIKVDSAECKYVSEGGEVSAESADTTTGSWSLLVKFKTPLNKCEPDSIVAKKQSCSCVNTESTQASLCEETSKCFASGECN